ncbi:Tat pathway signal protein [Afifella sp. H1R]|uniref:Acg family FMN-binding oxidoreductase n=1 Tax=Afifella sp. H1R TaxID=2908841 RepID=UPI001F3DA012|nr:Tat pathway signal protein [Afifella sp. H1R]MCF1504150.1 Tat pathway signal protein [Afifella sp. H1R]
MLSRRNIIVGSGVVLAGAGLSYSLWPGTDPAYAAAADASRRRLDVEAAGAASGAGDGETFSGLIRYATLAANSHNTQPWLFGVSGREIRIAPDFSRRCPAVDPEDRHLFASLGCAAENLVLAAGAAGFAAEARFDDDAQAAVISLTPAAAHGLPAFEAIPRRQSTRTPFDASPLSAEELHALEGAIDRPGVRTRFLTARTELDELKDFVVWGNTAQCGDAAFVEELRSWVRFNESDAVRRLDGLFAGVSGNPVTPRWLGRAIFPYVFTAAAENPKYVAQIDGAAGALVLFAEKNDAAGLFAVGRAAQRFMLEAEARDIRTSFVNQPVEVASVRHAFASWLGEGLRPALVLRFGRGAKVPMSLRRPAAAVTM